MRHLRVLILAIFGLFIIGPTVRTLPNVHGENAPPQQQSAQQISQLSLIETLGRGRINEVAWSHDETLMAVSSSTGIWLYEMVALDEPPTLLTHDADWYDDVTFSPNGQLLAIEQFHSDSYHVLVWNLMSQQPQSIIDGNERIGQIQFSPDSQHIAAIADNDTIWLANAESGELLGEWVIDNVTSLEFDNDNMLHVFSFDSELDMLSQWRIHRDESELIGTQATNNVPTITFHEGRFLLAEQVDQTTLSLIDFESGALVLSFQAPSTVWKVLFRDEHLIVSYLEGIQVWHIEYGELLNDLHVVRRRFSPLWVSPSGLHITYLDHYLLRFMDVVSGEEIAVLDEFYGTIIGMDFSPSDDLLAVGYSATATGNGTLRLWDTMSPTHMEFADIFQSQDRITALTFNPMGNMLAYASEDYPFHIGINIWHFGTRDMEPLLDTDCTGVICVITGLQFNPDSTTVATTLSFSFLSPPHIRGRVVYFLNSESAQEWDFDYVEPDLPSPSPDVPNRYPLLLDYIPSSTELVHSSVIDYTVRLVDTEAPGRYGTWQFTTLYEHPAETIAMQVNPNGTLIVSGDADGNLIQFDLTTNDTNIPIPFRFFTISDNAISAIDFHPNSQHIALATEDQVIIYDITSMQEVATVVHNNVEFVDFNYDGTILATANVNGIVKIWAVN